MSLEDNVFICDNCGSIFHDSAVKDDHYKDCTFCSTECLIEYKLFDGGDDSLYINE